MNRFPDRQQQILTMHAAFINQVVELSQRDSSRAKLKALLKSATDNGWEELVRALREILKGRRDPGLFQGLDEEDQVIAEAVLRGLQNPATLPDPTTAPDPTMAAPGLASMIHAAASGNVEALRIISEMAQQMTRAGGQMARLASVIRPLINGERDPDRLCKGMDSATEHLVLGILEQLGKEGLH